MNEVDLKEVVFVDCETTGLNHRTARPWEIALIVGATGEEHVFHVNPVREPKGGEMFWVPEAGAFRVNRFYSRVQKLLKAGLVWDHEVDVAWKVATLTEGKHLVGNVTSFDSGMIEELLWRHGLVPAWHYHLVDVENLVAGKLKIPPPWKSQDLSKAVGVKPPEGEDAHTALADARWARDLYLAVYKE